jgi:hypothetical protein
LSEAKFTKDFKKHLKKLQQEHGHSFYFYKVSDRFTSGIPDFFIAFRGLSIYIELKDLGESPSIIQLHQMKRLQQAGIIAVWFDSLAPAKEFLDELVSERAALSL